MSRLVINYSVMGGVATGAEKASQFIDAYQTGLSNSVANRIGGYTGAYTGNISAAASVMQSKNRELAEKSAALGTYAQTVRNNIQACKDADTESATAIQLASTDFKTRHDIGSNPVIEFFSYMWTSIVNSNPITRFFSDCLRNLGNWASDLWTVVKNWYNYEGGHFIRDMLFAAGKVIFGLVLLVGAILTGGGLIVMLAAAFGAFIMVMDGWTDMRYSEMAYYSAQNGEAAMAWRQGQTDTWTGSMRTWSDSKFSHWAANILDVATIVCSLISLGNSLGKLGGQVYKFATGNSLESFGNGYQQMRALWQNRSGLGGGIVSACKNFFTGGNWTFDTTLSHIFRNGANILFKPFDTLNNATKLSEWGQGITQMGNLGYSMMNIFNGGAGSFGLEFALTGLGFNKDISIQTTIAKPVKTIINAFSTGSGIGTNWPYLDTYSSFGSYSNAISNISDRFLSGGYVTATAGGVR